MAKHRVGIIGATGYTGSELARILVNHPDIEIAFITSESRAGEAFSAVHPAFQGILDLPLQTVDEALSLHAPPELVFLALPHGVSMAYVARLQAQPFAIIDFSGDFRLSSAEVYQQWYQKPHTYLSGFEQAVYGLPELYAEEIKTAKLVANPGCFPTSAILALAPLLQAGKQRLASVIIDSKTGVTGAGVKASSTTHFSNAHDNFKAYGIKSHRHTIEIQEILGQVGQASPSSVHIPPVLFTPHLLPLDRGILSTIYVPTPDPCAQEQLMDLYRDFYADTPFVRMCGHSPSLKEVRGSNYCNLYVDYDPRTQTILILSAIDNLVKGAAGQAVQNMNLMLGLPETQGLNLIPMQP